VAINTGEHTKQLRGAQRSPLSRRLADLAADHFGGVEAALRLGLRVSSVAQRWVGPGPLEALSGSLHRLSNARLPQWNRYMPRNGSPLKVPVSRQRDRVVYFPSCVSRAMGPAMGDPDVDPLHAVTVRVLDRAGYDVIHPEPVTGLCCGTPFESKGFFEQADRKSKQLENALLTATHGGRLPVLCDTSPCLYRMRKVMTPLLKMYEPSEFITRFLLSRLNFRKLSNPVALHHTCSNVKMGLENHLEAAARACSREVIVPELVGCCGFAGDRGFNYPELNASALKALNGALGPACEAGYSTSRTCEIGLSRHSGVFYKSIFYLVDRCTSASPNIL
jgi:D-lactate dehydrogenase